MANFANFLHDDGDVFSGILTLCSESIHKVNVELVEKPVNGITHITLSIRLCASHRHFPKKLVFFVLQSQIACVRGAR